MIKLDSITDNALPETMIQDICELDNINSIMILTIAYDEINWDICSSLSLKFASWKLNSLETY
jgi:hypothetical protein